MVHYRHQRQHKPRSACHKIVGRPLLCQRHHGVTFGGLLAQRRISHQTTVPQRPLPSVRDTSVIFKPDTITRHLKTVSGVTCACVYVFEAAALFRSQPAVTVPLPPQPYITL